MDEVRPETIIGIFWCLASPISDATEGRSNPLTYLSLRMTLLSLERYIVVGAESEEATLALERRQVPTVFTLGTTGPFQVEPDSEPNARTKFGNGLTELADVLKAGISAFGFTLWWS